MSDDFEKAVLFSFDQTGSISPEIKAQANALLQQAQQSPDAWQLCLQRLSSSGYAEVRFWCLQTLHGITKGPSYPSLTPQTRTQIKQALVELGTRPPPHQLPPYIRNKVAQTLVTIAGREYPDQWPNFFQDLMGTLSQGPPAVDLFCRILTSIDEDIISLDVPRSAAEAKQSMHFKDSMREGPLPEIAATWCQLVATYQTSSPELAAAVLETTQRYVHWIDISLIANDAFMPRLFACLTAPDIRVKGAAADVLTEVVSKRMEAGAKLNLIQTLGVVPECSSWRNGLPGVDEDPSLGIKYAKLLAALATEALEAWKKVENSVLSMQAVGLDVSDEAGGEATAACRVASSILDALFPAVLRTLRNEDYEVSAAMAPFLQSHVSRLRTLQKRNNGVLGPENVAQLLPIQESVAESARFNNDSDVYATMSSTDVDKYVVFSLFTGV